MSAERHFFISSLSADAQKAAQAVRANWPVENALHWTVNVVFDEDESRVRRTMRAPHNMALIRHFPLNMLNNVKKGFNDVSVKALCKKARWGNSLLQLFSLYRSRLFWDSPGPTRHFRVNSNLDLN